MAQYYKLKKKIEAGAKFIITQVGYDGRKFHEVMQWLRVNGYDVPAIANVYILPFGAAKLMNANGIPGCVVTDKLVAELAEEKNADDKGKSARLLRAAKMYAMAKGMGYAGAHIGGHGITYEMVEYIIDKGEELSVNWEALVPEFEYPQNEGFYLFEKDSKTGLNTERLAERALKPSKPFVYRFSRLAHEMLFNEKSWRFKMLRPIAKRVDSSPGLKRAFDRMEHLAKVVMFSCMNCGDCALFDVAFVCPMSQCPKSQRNGACGGSYKGWCEVYPNEKKCIWVQAYERLKPYGEEDTLGGYIVPPCNWELWQTSSWLNFYLGRDHTAKRLGIKPPGEEPSPEESVKPGGKTEVEKTGVQKKRESRVPK
jgi:methylenetetrahydrofolate reductase (NADPH)